MKARITIEYECSRRGSDALRDQKEQCWISSETLLQLRSAVVKVELIDAPGRVSSGFSEPMPEPISKFTIGVSTTT